MSHELCLTTSAEFLVYPVPGKVCAIVLGQFVTRKASADELDQIATFPPGGDRNKKGAEAPLLYDQYSLSLFTTAM